MYVASGGTFTMTSPTFSGNKVINNERAGGGGAVYVESGGTFTVTSSAFSTNTACNYALGGALYFDGTGLIKNCTFVGPTTQPIPTNDIYNNGANVTFACADGEVGTPVQMQGTEIAVIPPKELKCTAPKYICNHGGTPSAKCVLGVPGLSLEKCQQACVP
jgi:hypothetical protein